MSRRKHYGKLGSLAHPEAYRIWLNRYDELSPSPEFGMSALMVADGPEDRITARQVIRVAEQVLLPWYFNVFMLRFDLGLTLEEAGQSVGVTRERIRQMEITACRTVRKALLVEELPTLSRQVSEG